MRRLSVGQSIPIFEGHFDVSTIRKDRIRTDTWHKAKIHFGFKCQCHRWRRWQLWWLLWYNYCYIDSIMFASSMSLCCCLLLWCWYLYESSLFKTMIYSYEHAHQKRFVGEISLSRGRVPSLSRFHYAMQSMKEDIHEHKYIYIKTCPVTVYLRTQTQPIWFCYFDDDQFNNIILLTLIL